MATTITEITECFEYFFSSLYRREFVKTLRLNECSERELLPLVRCYLLGWFADNVSPEVKSKLPGTVSGHGYIDFVIDDVAVEFAVRKPTASRSNVSATVNSTEVKKLMKHNGKALLVLFDFSDTPYSEEQIESFPQLALSWSRESSQVRIQRRLFLCGKTQTAGSGENHQKHPYHLTGN